MKKIQLLFLAFILSIGGLKAQTDIVITEIGYNQAETGSDSTEFIELFNKGLVDVDLEDFYFTAGVIYVMPSIIMAPGDYIVIAKDSLAMISAYGYVGAYQWTTGELNDAGEGITIRNGGGGLVDAVTYNDVSPWPTDADGLGKTIVICDVELNNALGVNWAASESSTGTFVEGFEVFGSPGEQDLACIDCATTFATIEEAVCDSYTVPSGDETYDVSGTYTDTLTNDGGCDSIITIELTVNFTVESDFEVISCGPYTVPSGDETYEETGVYMDTIPSIGGCDSIMTIDVTILLETASTITETICGTYTVPSGDETYDVSGTYSDTLTNDAGCDSIITIELTISLTVESDFEVISCGPYTVPSGDEMYEETGVYMDTIPSIGGCDSIMTISVIIASPSESEISETVCGSYTVPSGDETYELSGVYTDTLTNDAGCDSIITIDLTVNFSTPSEITAGLCGGVYTVPSGDETYDVPGVYMDTIPTMGGCDSIITINLGFGEPTLSEIAEFVCGTYTVPSGDETYDVGGVYMDTIPNMAGCDSIITITLTIGEPSESEISETVCNSYTVPSGDTTYTESGIYTDILTNEEGCDSIITIDLTVTVINDGVTSTETSATAVQAGAEYQWVDCDNDNEPILGETDQVFEPTVNGNYACEVTVGECTVTTACVNFSTLGINGEDNIKQVAIYPNPSTGLVNIDLTHLTGAAVNIISLDGRVVYQTALTSNELLQVQLDAAPGVYFVQVQHNGAQKQFKLILQ